MRSHRTGMIKTPMTDGMHDKAREAWCAAFLLVELRAGGYLASGSTPLNAITSTTEPSMSTAAFHVN